jgi:hypothetical protein
VAVAAVGFVAAFSGETCAVTGFTVGVEDVAGAAGVGGSEFEDFAGAVAVVLFAAWWGDADGVDDLGGAGAAIPDHGSSS